MRTRMVAAGDLKPGDRIYVTQTEERTVRSVTPSASGVTVAVQYSGGGYHQNAPRQPRVGRKLKVIV